MPFYYKERELTIEMIDELDLPKAPDNFMPDVLYRGHTWDEESVGFELFKRIGYYVSTPVERPGDHFTPHFGGERFLDVKAQTTERGSSIGPVSEMWEKSKEEAKRRRIKHLMNKWWDLSDLKWVYKMEQTIKGKTIFR